MGTHLDAVVGALDEGRQPEGRHFVFVQVDESKIAEDGTWSSSVSVFDAEYKPPREDIAAAIGKVMFAVAAGSAAGGAAMNSGASLTDATNLGSSIAGGVESSSEDMLPATLFLDDTGHDVVVTAYLPPGALVAAWLEFGPDGVAIPVVDSILGGLNGPYPSLVYPKMDVEDVYRAMQRLKLPNSRDDTRRRYEKARKKLASGAAVIPEEIEGAITMLDGSAGAVREIHERHLREQLARGTHASTDHVALGRLLAEDGRHEEAISEFEAATALDGDRPDLALERATCLYMLQRDAEAWELLEQPLADNATLAVHLCNQIAARSGYDISRCTADELDELPW
jgi:tetratricopeptide (TPR) repeat protein